MAGYPGQYGNVLVRKETLDKSLNTIIGAPVIITHKDVTVDNADDLRVGVISNAYYNEKDGWYWCEGVIWDETAQNLITDKKWSVSCSYDFLEQDDEGGTENNIPYDREFTKLNFVHLALVDNPRYERANIVFNSKTVINNQFKEEEHPRDEQGRFTSGGNGVNPNYQNELKQVIDKAKNNPNERQKLVIGIVSKDLAKKAKENGFDITGYEHNLDVSGTRHTLKTHGNEKKEDSRGQIAITDEDFEKIPDVVYTPDNISFGETDAKDTPLIKYSKKFDDGTVIYVEEIRTRQKTLTIKSMWKQKNIADNSCTFTDFNPQRPEYISTIIITDNQEDFNPMIKNNVQNWNEADHPRDEAGKFTEKWERVRKTQENYGRKVKLKDGHKTGIILGSVPRGDNPDSGEEMYQYEIKWDDGKIERLHSNKVDLITDLKELEKEIEDHPQGWMTPRNLERIKKQKSLQETKGWTQKEIKDFYSSSIAGDDYAKKWEYAKAHPWRDLTITNNNKEQDMALLDELKKLITKVENDKGEDMDNTIENEKVDKRDIIRQIMAIAGKREDDEDVRTIAKLAEKLAYEKSEAGTADNGNDDKEDEKADNKKVKNNETKEDEKKDEELKKNVKEDVQNKCKNSVDNSKGGFFDKINEIYNSAMKPKEENIYVSRADKLKAAEEYFS